MTKMHTTKVNSNGDSLSTTDSPSNFKALFGNDPEQHSPVSSFSDNNPFRRNQIDRSQTPQQSQQERGLGLGLGFGSAEDLENDSDGGYENPSLVDVKKRNRRGKKPSSDLGVIDEDLETHLEIKKLKIDEGKNPNFGVGTDERGEGKGPDLGFDLKESLKRGKGKDPYLSFKSMELLKQDVGMELNGEVSLDAVRMGKRREKKRKRDELEARSNRIVMNGEAGGEGLGARVGGKRKKVDDPVEMMVSEEGSDDESKLLRTVFVGNLPLMVKKKVLVKEFSQFGEIESLKIRSIPLLDTKKPRKRAVIQKKINYAVDRVHANIVFKTEQAARASLSHNMAVVGENHIHVDRACPPLKKLKGENAVFDDNKRTLFVGNLPSDVKDEEIYQLFSGIKDLESSIEAIRVIRNSGTSVGKGIAYVLFKTQGAANLAVKNHSFNLRNRELSLHLARSNLTPSKRKNTSRGERDDPPFKKLAVDLTTPSSSNKVNTKSESKRKRPAVAARKANALKSGGVLKQAGGKRKLESATPEASRPYKRSREFM
ncbi:Nucleolar protein [Actinidia chinensis var. chinensis]|uniref:Nucleolar protein n=1 Tax=Actinidia chinensis var. chinensis TaxID=1590841 RepID=A0A2R6PIE0_ACTCC|nr:Nucleolar protein [Actinidia chinensis var. chinensis]